MLVRVRGRLTQTSGQAAVEYVGVLLVVTAVVVACISSSIPHRITGGIAHEIACLFDGGTCTSHGGDGAQPTRADIAQPIRANIARAGASLTGSADPVAHPAGPPADAMFAQRSSYFTAALHYCMDHPTRAYHPDTNIKGSGWIQCQPYLKDMRLGKFSLLHCIETVTGLSLSGALVKAAHNISKSADATIEEAGKIVEEAGKSIAKDFTVYAAVIACAQGGQSN